MTGADPIRDRRKDGLLLTAGLVLLFSLLPTAAGALTLADREASERPGAVLYLWELGLGLQGGSAGLREASARDPFKLDESLSPGFAVDLSRRFTPRVSFGLELSAGVHDSNIEGVTGTLTSLSLNFRYGLPGRGPLRPFLRGGFGIAGMKIDSDVEAAESLELQGMMGVFGGGLRFDASPRLKIDLELSHGVINYEDASVTLPNVYTGTRIDKAGEATRLKFGTLFLF